MDPFLFHSVLLFLKSRCHGGNYIRTEFNVAGGKLSGSLILPQVSLLCAHDIASVKTEVYS